MATVNLHRKFVTVSVGNAVWDRGMGNQKLIV